MAGLTVESHAAPAAQGPLEHQIQELASLLGVATLVAGITQPGVLLGAAVAGLWTWLYRPPVHWRLAIVAACLLPLVALWDFVLWAWPWHLALAQVLPDAATQIAPPSIKRSVIVEVLAGPIWFELICLYVVLRRRRVGAEAVRFHRREVRRWRALTGQATRSLPSPGTPTDAHGAAHPPGSIRLGTDQETRRPFDLALPDEIAQHVFLPGTSGSGKTTTLTRLADGALTNAYAVLIVDCKGGDLGHVASRLAASRGVPMHVVDPDRKDGATLGYNPCSGDPSSVANKLVGAFTYSPNAEIYKNIAMEAIPVVVRALQAAGDEVTLDALSDAFENRGLEKLAQRLAQDHPVRERLLRLAEQDSDAGKSGRAGLRYRLGALLEGKFGDLFRTTPALDWDAVLASPSVTYIALSALASSEDVELMGRVLAQDIKQVCARRLQALAAGSQVLPVLAIWDEFAALREAEQIRDLLLQARQALMPTVVSVQYMPESVAVRQSVLGAGLIIAHRLEAEDAQLIAAQFGTRSTIEPTHQMNYETGETAMGSLRRGEAYVVHPNELRNLRPGQAVVRSAPMQRHALVQVLPVPTAPSDRTGD